MRLFTAIELPETVRNAVHAAAAPVLRPLPACRAVPAENLHVTVRFLGDVPPDRTERLHRALRRATVEAAPCRLRAAGFGAFPDLRRVRVIWVGIDDPSHGTTKLERAVTRAIAPLGFEPDPHAWTPHVTVARLGDPPVVPPGAPPLPRFVPPPREAYGPEFEATHLVLFESELTRQGSRYRVVERYPLARGGRPQDEPAAARGGPGPQGSP